MLEHQRIARTESSRIGNQKTQQLVNILGEDCINDLIDCSLNPNRLCIDIPVTNTVSLINLQSREIEKPAIQFND